jgi:hypothetical protein
MHENINSRSNVTYTIFVIVFKATIKQFTTLFKFNINFNNCYIIKK